MPNIQELINAAGGGHKDIVENLLHNGVDVNGVGNWGWTPLIFAAWNGHKEVVKILLQKEDIEIDKANRGVTALMHAVQKGHKDIVVMLLKRGADVNKEITEGAEKGKTALMIATEKGFEEIVELLKNSAKLAKAGKNTSHIIVDKEKQKQLLQAVRSGNITMIRDLVSKGVDINDCNNDFKATALHIGVLKGQYEVVAALLELNADINIKDKKGQTALAIAQDKKYDNIVTLLGGRRRSSTETDAPLPLSHQGKLKLISKDHIREKYPNIGDIDQLFYHDIAENHNYRDFAITAIYKIENKRFKTGFQERIATLGKRAGNEAFAPQHNEKYPQELRKRVIDRLNNLSYVKDDAPGVKFINLWHGTRREMLDSILDTGLVNLKKTDGGYFGAGIYGSTSSEYPKRCYAGGGGERYDKGILFLSTAVFHSAYPIAGSNDLNMFIGQSNIGKGNYANYDAHFVAVKPQSNFPHEISYIPLEDNNDQITYDEFVAFEQTSFIPRFLVETSRIIPHPLKEANAPAKDHYNFIAKLYHDEEVKADELYLIRQHKDNEEVKLLIQPKPEISTSIANDNKVINKQGLLTTLLITKQHEIKTDANLRNNILSSLADTIKYSDNKFIHRKEIIVNNINKYLPTTDKLNVNSNNINTELKNIANKIISNPGQSMAV